MTGVDNFKWLATDINNTIILKVFNGKKFFGVFNVVDVLDTVGDSLDVKTANIDDLTNMLTLGIVRFANICDSSDILDIPLRSMNKLYENVNVVEHCGSDRCVSFADLDMFSVIDDEVRDDFIIYPGLIAYPSEDLKKVMKIASEFGGYGMQEKLDALNDITFLNHRRIVDDKKNRSFK